MNGGLARRLLAEFLGSAFLAAVVIGSGIAAQQLSPGVAGLQLLYNSAATAAGLFAIILMFGRVSGGHFNPVVSLVDAAFGGLSRRHTLAYIPTQVAGCVAGAVAANAMFSLSAISISGNHRAEAAHLFAEVIATLGLLLVIFALARRRGSRVRGHPDPLSGCDGGRRRRGRGSAPRRRRRARSLRRASASGRTSACGGPGLPARPPGPGVPDLVTRRGSGTAASLSA